MKLEDIAWNSPLKKSVTPHTIHLAIEWCRSIAEDFEGLPLLKQHARLEECEKVLNGQGWVRDGQNDVLRATAYSILAHYHTAWYKRNLDRFRSLTGPKADTKLFDINYFAGRNDFNTPFQFRLANPVGFHEKAREHFEEAYTLWHDMAWAHAEIAYRQARIADVCYHLHRLRMPPDNFLLDTAVKYLRQADSRLAPDSPDLRQVQAIAQAMMDWFSHDESHRYLDHSMVAARLLEHWRQR